MAGYNTHSYILLLCNKIFYMITNSIEYLSIIIGSLFTASNNTNTLSEGYVGAIVGMFFDWHVIRKIYYMIVTI